MDIDGLHVHPGRVAVIVYDERIPEWVAERIPHVSDFGPCAGLGVVSDSGKVMAGVVYNNWMPEFGTIELSMAADSPMWARKVTIAGLLAYPFVQLGAFKVWTATPIGNEAALRVNEKIGFKQEAILAHHFGEGTHCVIRRMLRPQYFAKYGNLIHASRNAA